MDSKKLSYRSLGWRNVCTFWLPGVWKVDSGNGLRLRFPSKLRMFGVGILVAIKERIINQHHEEAPPFITYTYYGSFVEVPSLQPRIWG